MKRYLRTVLTIVFLGSSILLCAAPAAQQEAPDAPDGRAAVEETLTVATGQQFIPDAATAAQPVPDTVPPPPARRNSGNPGGRGTVEVESADYSKYDTENRLTVLKGNIYLRYTEEGREGEVRIRAQEAVVDERAKTATARGGVTVRDGDLEISGESLFYKFKDKYFEMAKVKGSAEGGQDVKGRMYFEGERAQGTERKVKIYHSRFSTCGPYCPGEYHMTASDISIFPEKRVIARRVGVYLRNTRIMFMPVYVASLKEEESYRPEFGYNKTEGFYVKTRYPYIAEAPVLGRQASTAWLILNYMQKTGNEYGTENKYYSGRLKGNGYFLYTTNNQKNTGYANDRSQVNQDFTISKKLAGGLKYNRTNTYNTYRPGFRTNTNTMDWALNYNQSPGKTLATNYRLTANKGSSDSENTTLNVARRTRLGKKLNLDYSFDETSIQSGPIPENREGTFRSTTTYLGKIYRLTMNTFKNFDMDGDSYSGDRSVTVNNQKLPEITMALDPRLWNKKMPYIKTFQIITGRYRRGTRSKSDALRRNELQAMATNQYKFGKLTVTPRQTYTQRMYSTKDAMYVMDHSTVISYKQSERTTVNANYQKTGDSGGTPYPADRRSEMIQLNGDITMAKNSVDPMTGASRNTTMFRMSTSYNYKTLSYSPLAITYTRAVSRNSLFQLTGSKDLNRHVWGDATTRFDVKRKNTRLLVNTTWATRDFDIRNMDFTTEHTRRNGWKTQVRGRYQHKNPHGIIRNIIATKTRCCTEMQFFYDLEKEEFRFQYYILAFPTRKFGFTQGPQGLEIDDTFMEFKSEEQGEIQPIQ